MLLETGIMNDLSEICLVCSNGEEVGFPDCRCGVEKSEQVVVC